MTMAHQTLVSEPAPGRAGRSIADLFARRPELVSLGLLIVICVTVALINPAFLDPGSLIDMARASVVTGLFALGVIVVLAAGGSDVSFTALAALTAYSLTLFVLNIAPGMPMAAVLAIAIIAGAMLGAINGLLVQYLQVAALIVTIGTQYLFRGILLAFIGTVWLMELPPQMVAFGKAPLLDITTANGAVATLPVYFLIFSAAALLTAAIFNRTLMGRAIFATGDSPQVASRLGYDRRIVHVFAYAGALAGLEGIVHVSANRMANPFDFAGTEIGVVAAVVLGGAPDHRRHRIGIGTVIGVLLIAVVNNVLVLVGTPSTSQRVVVGAFILLAAAFFVTRRRKTQSRTRK